jgi:hypothetical protein
VIESLAQSPPGWRTLLTAAEAAAAGVGAVRSIRFEICANHDGGINSKVCAVRVRGGAGGGGLTSDEARAAASSGARVRISESANTRRMRGGDFSGVGWNSEKTASVGKVGVAKSFDGSDDTCKVEVSGVGTNWYPIDALTIVPADVTGAAARPTFGDRVRILSGTGEGGDAVVVKDDHDSSPYKLSGGGSSGSWYNESSVQLLPPETFAVGDRVVCIGDAAAAESLAEGHGGWVGDMRGALGKVGEVTELMSSANIRVKCASNTFVWNPKCWSKLAGAAGISTEQARAAAASGARVRISESANTRRMRDGDFSGVSWNSEKTASLGKEGVVKSFDGSDDTCKVEVPGVGTSWFPIDALSLSAAATGRYKRKGDFGSTSDYVSYLKGVIKVGMRFRGVSGDRKGDTGVLVDNDGTGCPNFRWDDFRDTWWTSLENVEIAE